MVFYLSWLQSMTKTDRHSLFESRLDLKLLNRGKVRDIYEVDDQHLLIIASDRLSAFDVVLPQPIPGKGEVLTRLANFWFQRMSSLIPNHLVQIPLEEIVADSRQRHDLGQRCMIVRKLNPLPIEAIVRGYLIGSGWKDYQQHGSVCGIQLPDKLQQADRLPNAIFTPSTKADVGDHDDNIDFTQVKALLGTALAEQVRQVSLSIYTQAVDYALTRGIIIADTKLEFGLDHEGRLHLIDEVLTPDSSRFWPADSYRPGISPISFDKQYVRDYLETLDWDKTPPGPELPQEVIDKTAEKYREAERRLTEPM
jgi:phosphoribosylaminoimidazole-succinocarboxamide synthase